VPAFA